jgi:hypothetical protein
MVSKIIPSEKLRERNHCLEAAGAVNITCSPISGQEGFSTIRWEWPVRSQRKPMGAFRRARLKRRPSNAKPIRRSRTITDGT